MENQCVGVAEALNLSPVMKRITLRQPWKSLCPFLGLETAWSFKGDTLTSPWPDIAIGCGRKSIAALRYIKRVSKDKTFTVFIQNPKIKTDCFDLVAVPAHDSIKGENVLVTTAAPGRLNRAKLQQGGAAWSNIFSAIPAPRVAVLIGGDSKTHRLTAENITKLASQLRELAAHGYSLMITTSRRTGEANAATLRAGLAETQAWIWDGQGDNPYFGMLGWADYVIATSDSVSMISESAVTGKPVYIAPIEGGSARFDRFYRSMMDKGIARMFEGTLEDYRYEPPDDTKLIADEIRRRMAS